jgi:hypothetical protein
MPIAVKIFATHIFLFAVLMVVSCTAFDMDLDHPIWKVTVLLLICFLLWPLYFFWF